MNDACVIGYGMVGRATAKMFSIEKYCDLKGSNMELSDAKNMKYVFLCLPTNLDAAGWYDYEPFWNVLPSIVGQDNILIIRSTVYPGFSQTVQKELKKKKIVSNPEFLSEASWEEDVKNPKMIVIGSDDPKARDDVLALYRGRYKYTKPIMTDSVTAELIKLTFNSFFADKIMFFNEIYDIARGNGANYETIKTALENHPWGSKNHMTVEYKGKRGIHGRCLPKDLEAFSKWSGSQLLKTIHEMNRRFL